LSEVPLYIKPHTYSPNRLLTPQSDDPHTSRSFTTDGSLSPFSWLPFPHRSRANMAHIRQSRPDSGLDVQVEVFQRFLDVHYVSSNECTPRDICPI